MGINCGIIGLPNVGKSSLFSALTHQEVLVANYPFATIEPNQGIIWVPDERLQKIAECIPTQKIIPTSIKMVDIAGLVKNAHKGEGLGNSFLSHIRQVDLIIHVVRCFSDTQVSHVDSDIDPLSDIDTILTELCLADLASVEKKLEKYKKVTHKQLNQSDHLFLGHLHKAHALLSEGKWLYTHLDEASQNSLNELFLLSSKPMILVCNVDEKELYQSALFDKVNQFAQNAHFPIIAISHKLEHELSQLEEEERNFFLKEYNIVHNPLNDLILKAYSSLNLSTFFTAGEKEIRAWTCQKNSTAPEAAHVIHSDFSKGFIKAEVYSYQDLIQYRTFQQLKANGLIRMEGRQYLVKDGDIVHFFFNV